MSRPGYHPVCVLFQGNDCAFDGTYRLVCRHQIRQKDFQPGDNVEVSIGDEEEDVFIATNQDDDVRVLSNNGDGRRWRDAIALGDEMVMLLLRNMCKNQPAGKSPWGLDRQTKRKREPGESETVYMDKKIKTESTTLQGNQERAQDFQSKHHLQTILSAVRSVQATQDHLVSEIRTIQDHQLQLNNQVMAIQKTLYQLEENILASNCKSEELDSIPTPVSLHHTRPGTTSSGLDLNVRTDSLGSLQSVTSPVQSTSSNNSLSHIVISNPVSQADVPAFPSSQEVLDPGPSTLPPLYPIEGTLYSPPQVPYNFRFTDDTESQVYLGYHNSPLKISKNDMEDILFKTNTPAAYAYRLTGKIFTKEELLHSNTSGKGNRRSGKDFQQLNVKYVDIILMETETRFPTCRDTKEGKRRLLGAINERCRNERKKIIYRYESVMQRNMKTANAGNGSSQEQNKN